MIKLESQLVIRTYGPRFEIEKPGPSFEVGTNGKGLKILNCYFVGYKKSGIYINLGGLFLKK